MAWWVAWYVVEFIAIFAIGGRALLLTMQIVPLLYVKFYMNKKPPKLPKRIEGVSILKPLKGTDPNLKENLETFFDLDYPQFEILFCIEDKHDPAHKVVQHLLSKHPNINARIITGGNGKNSIGNPKINNLIPAYKIMQYNLFWICDSGICVSPLTLRDLVSKMTEGVGLVQALPYPSYRKGFANIVEKVFFGTQHTRMYICAHVLGLLCTSGSSMLIRRDYLDKSTGGLHSLAQYIAEDYFLAKRLCDKGYKVALASCPVYLNSGDHCFTSFTDRLTRWTTLRLYMVPFAVIMEPLSECFLSGFLLSWACLHYFSWDMLVVFLFHSFFWVFFDYALCRELETGRFQIAKFDFVIAWLVRETLTPYIILRALSDTTIKWRGRKYHLECGGTVKVLQGAVYNV